MASYFVKKGGSDSNNGTTWALAKLTIQAALNLANAAEDRVIVAPGIYSEQLTDPAASGTSIANPSYFIGDTQGTIADGGSNYHGVTAGKIVVAKNVNGNLVLWDTTNYWKVQGIHFINGDMGANRDTRAVALGTAGSASYGLGMVFEDCLFYCSSFGLVVLDGSTQVYRRCIFYGTCPALVRTKKSTDFNSTPDGDFYSCVFIRFSENSSSQLGLLNNYATDGGYHTFLRATNCVFMGVAKTAGSPAFYHNSGTYSKCQADRCIATDSVLMTDYNTQSIVNNSYYTHSASGFLGTRIDRESAHAAMYTFPLWDSECTLIDDVTDSQTGEDSYDLIGKTLSNSPGPIQYTAKEVMSEGRKVSGRGVAKLWSADYPDPGNVTEDDTTDGVTGTYHEAATTEVQSGVMFGAASALQGTYTGGSGASGGVTIHKSIGIGVV